MKRNLWLLLAVAVCAVSAAAGLRTRPGREAAPADRGPAPAVHLRILNGTEASGLARDVGRDLGAAGLVIEGLGNTSRPAARSVLVDRRLGPAAAQDLARRLGGVPVVREWDGRCSEDAVLVLGADWSWRGGLSAGD